MVRGLLLLMMFVAEATLAANSLTVRVDRNAVVLGESLQLEITAQVAGATPPLETLSLDVLRANFEIQDLSRNLQTGMRDGRLTTTQILTVTLYPLRSGRLKIPKLNILQASSLELAIMVQDAGTSIPRVLLRAGIEPRSPHARETVLLYLDVYDNGSLVWAPIEVPTAPGLYLRALAQSRRNDSIDGATFNVLRYAWAATPLRDGEHTLQFPLLRAHKFGVRLRYAAPPLTFTAQAVPAYLPVHVSVGPAPELQVENLPLENVVNRPENWRLRVSGTGLSANGLAQMLAATLGAAPGIQFYPLDIEAEDATRATGLAQTFHVTLPFQALQHGELELPELALPYFDPQRERLASVVLAGQRITAISPWRQRVLWGGGVGIALLVLAWPARRLVVALRRYRQRARGLRRIQRAQNIHALKTALLEFDAVGTSTYKPPPTLRQWLRHARIPQRLDAELCASVFRLERGCYANHSGADDFSDLQRALLWSLK